MTKDNRKIFLEDQFIKLGLYSLIENESWDKKLDYFLSYYEMLIERNKVMNLTAITDFSDVVIKHFVDSLSICKVIDLSKPLCMLDLGTGAGFPGIPLKIMFPHLNVVLMDSLNKRISFLKDVINKLHMNHISAVHGRAEEMARKSEYRGQFDFVVSRAVANLSSLSEYCIPFVKNSGYFISYKSGDINQELEDALYAIRLLGGKKEQIYQFQLPDTDISRSFVKIKKIHDTSKLYPRKAGMPSKEPLHS